MKKTCALLALAFVLTSLPMASLAADIQMENNNPPSFTLSTSVVGVAGQEWWVVGYNGAGVYSTEGDDAVTLLSKSADFSTPYGNSAFRTRQMADPGPGWTFFPTTDSVAGGYYENNPAGYEAWTTPSEYNGSTLQLHLLGTSVLGTFSLKEQALINPRTLSAADGSTYPMAGPDAVDQKLWPISRNEWNTLGTAAKSYGSATRWWSRSVTSPAKVTVISPYSDISGSEVPQNDRGVRPAFSLAISSVLFTSAASGASGTKADATVGGNLVSTIAPLTVSTPTKFTVKAASSQTLNVSATVAQATQSSSTLAFSYSGATAGPGQYVSCVLLDANTGAVAYYGKLADSSATASGTLFIPLIGVVDGTYTLKIFSEEANGNNFTDFCSDPVSMTLEVTSGTGTISDFGGPVSDDAGLASVWGNTVSPGTEAGTDSAPKTASTNVENSVAQILLTDIVPHFSGATVALYSDAGYTTPTSPITLIPGANALYIKITAVDGATILHYKVTVNRAFASSSSGGSFSNSSISPKTVIAQYNAGGTYADIPITLTSNGNALIQVKNGNNVLEKGKDYTVNGNTITFTGSYLDTLTLGGHTITFDMSRGTAPQLIITIPEKIAQTWINPFTDVTMDDWFYADIAYVHENGLFNGTSSSTFSPQAAITRGMVVTVLGRLAGIDIKDYSGASFDDVNTAQYYAPYIKWAAETGIVKGVGNNNFMPDANISRQDLAVILSNYVDKMGIEMRQTMQNVVFVDSAEIADYATNAVSDMVRAGIINGRPGNIFDAKGEATRAEVAAMLHRFVLATY